MRGASTVALGAVVAALLVVTYYRSSDGDAPLAPPPSSSGGRLTETDAGADDLREAPPPTAAASAPTETAGSERNAQPELEPVSALRPNEVAATPMSQALEDLEIPPIPELLAAERDFAAQTADPVWATATEARILDKIAGIAGLQLVSLDAECKSTTCRLQLVRPEPVQGAPLAVFPRSESITDLVPAGLKPVWVIAVKDRNGTPVSLAYLERMDGADTASATFVPDAP